MNGDTRTRRSTFEELHAENSDPWLFETSPYELEKRNKLRSSLQGRRFGSAVEIGCSNGVLTAELAPYCDHLLGIDVAQSAIELAKDRLAGLENIELRRGEIPRDWPAGRFDLIVLSEVLYFLTEKEIADTAGLVWQSLMPHGLCIVVNWTGPTDLDVDGEGAARIFSQAEPWESVYLSRQPGYRLDHLKRT